MCRVAHAGQLKGIGAERPLTCMKPLGMGIAPNNITFPAAVVQLVLAVPDQRKRADMQTSGQQFRWVFAQL